MATLALFAAGSLIGGGLFPTGAFLGLTGAAIGGAIGGSIGGILDQTFLFPLFNNQKVSGPRLDDFQIQTNSEGSPINFVVGDGARVAGTLIYAGPLVERRKRKRVGGIGGIGGSKVTSYSYSITIAIGVCEGPISSIQTIWADGKVVYDNGVFDARYLDLDIYNGTQTTVDTDLEALAGAGEMQAHIGIAYVKIKSLQLADFGNRIPNFTFLVKQTVTPTLASAVLTIVGRLGVIPPAFDYSALSALDLVKGYLLSGPQNTIQALEPLLLAFAIEARERAGTLHFFPRRSSGSTNVEYIDMAAHELDQQVPQVLTLTDNPTRRLPDEMIVTYIDTTNDFQQASQRAKLNERVNRITATINMPMVLTPGQARAIAERELYSLYAYRSYAEFTLPPRWISIEEGDLLVITDGTQVFSVRITEANQGYNLITQVKGVLEQSQTLSSTPGTSSGTPTGHIPYAPPTLTFHALNLPPLADGEVQQPGFYVAVCATNVATEFRGAVIYGSTDNVEFDEFERLSDEGIIGATTNAVPSASVDVKDTINFVDVTLLNGSLASATADQVNRGTNWALVGNEIIAFETVASIGTNQYRLSNLYRGRRDTMDVSDLGGHVIGDRFILLDQSTVVFIPIETAEINQAIYLKAVPLYANAGDYVGSLFTPNGENVKNFRPRPVQRDTSKGGAFDIYITWQRRSRYVSRIFGGSANPLDEPFERYDVLIYENTIAGTLLRTVRVTDATFYNYTKSFQTEDGMIVPGGQVYVELYQLGRFVGRGNLASATLI